MEARDVCLVIGAGDGLGGANAKAFAAEGHSVVVTRRARHLDQLEALAREIGPTAHAFGVDARSEEETAALFERVEREIGPIGVVVFKGVNDGGDDD